jgi:hypothetical protein
MKNFAAFPFLKTPVKAITAQEKNQIHPTQKLEKD